MKSIIYIFCFVFLVGCSADNPNNRNPFLPNYQFTSGNRINTNLPEFNKLKFANNHVILDYGINGVVLFYAGGSNYNAFELTDPNHTMTTCSTLTVEGFYATCNCEDGNSYDILNGIGREGTTGEYPLIRYKVEVSGSIIRVFND